MDTPIFKPFPKIFRLLEQDIVITEKIDGTNALVHVSENGEVTAGSRNRWLSLEDDNYGFARWVEENKENLKELGPGFHYGEWWGNGIQRGYNMDKKVFSLFNAYRWNTGNLPSCCDVVPIIAICSFDEIKNYLIKGTSKASEKYGVVFDRPEGYMCYFSKSKTYFKVPLDK